MSRLCSEGCSPQYCKLIRLLCSYPPHHHHCPFLSSPFYPYASCLSESSICMAKQRFESWLAEPHAWLTALMSSLRFDDAANKGTRLITWPLNSAVTTTASSLRTLSLPRPPRPLHASVVPSSGEDLKMRSCLFEHKHVRRQGQLILETIGWTILSPLWGEDRGSHFI